MMACVEVGSSGDDFVRYAAVHLFGARHRYDVIENTANLNSAVQHSPFVSFSDQYMRR
jgi:hypothetical protein